MSMDVHDLCQMFEQKKASRVIMAGHGLFRVGSDYWEYLDSLNEDTPLETNESEGSDRGKLKRVGKKKKKVKTGRPAKKAYSVETGKSGADSLAANQSGKFQVPPGMSIYFYCRHGDKTTDSLCRSIEGFERGSPTPPSEVIRPGGYCYNYRLLFAYGLTLNMTAARAKYEVITIPESHRYRAVPLTTLLRDSRCAGATEVHWCACRVLASAQLDWRSEIMFGSASDRASFDKSRKFAG